ncbi:MAG: histidine kinase [Bacteroides sp. SM23_62_1]|nr:MAG: histidine kinase [Bacteroides sp. SM23_62_1]
MKNLTQKKEERYNRIYLQLKELLKSSPNEIARMATLVAVLHHKMDGFFWTGFYLLHDGDLMVGPYQGPLACQLLEKEKGVCWAAINSQKTISVPDVTKFQGHIACDSRSRSEIAVPLKNEKGKIVGVLDIDSKIPGHFDETDVINLEKIGELIYAV